MGARETQCDISKFGEPRYRDATFAHLISGVKVGLVHGGLVHGGLLIEEEGRETDTGELQISSVVRL